MKYFHTALSVTSTKKSQEFYEKVLGLTFKNKGGLPELGVRFIMLEDKESGSVIEFFEHDTPAKLNDDLMDFQQIGIKHIAFVVDDIESTIERAVANSGKVIWSPKKGVTVKRIAFISDPDGIPIELVEV